MVDRIMAYERESHIQVDKVAFAMDRYPMWCYPDIRCFGDLNVRTWVKPFARAGLLRAVSAREFRVIPFTGKSVQEVFGVENWNTFSPDQIKCIGDTAYIAIY